MKKKKLLYEGKAKKVYTTDAPDLLIQHFKDDATAFDGMKKGQITGKGEVNNKLSALLFMTIEEFGIPTHFVKLLGPRDMLVKRLDIVPVEVIVRNIAAGSISKRLGLEEGTRLKKTVLEFCYKSDELHDPMINDYHIAAMGLTTPSRLEKIKAYSMDINKVLIKFFKRVGIELVDFKLEFGLHKKRLLLGDEISPDTCRFWDAKTRKKLDKDRFRRDMGGVEDAYQEVWGRVREIMEKKFGADAC